MTDISCSFCGRKDHGDEVIAMVAGGNGSVHICDICIDVCSAVMIRRRLILKLVNTSEIFVEGKKP